MSFEMELPAGSNPDRQDEYVGPSIELSDTEFAALDKDDHSDDEDHEEDTEADYPELMFVPIKLTGM